MRLTSGMRRSWSDFLSSLQFLTRIPVPSQPYEADSLSRSVKFFPVVGALIGGAAALIHWALAPHLPRPAMKAIANVCVRVFSRAAPTPCPIMSFWN